MGLQENSNKYQRTDTHGNDRVELTFIKNGGTNKYVIACAIFASLNSVLLGYDVGVMPGAIIFIKEDQKISEDVFGRKWTIALAAIVFHSGAVIMALAPSFTVLMIGRVLAGVGTGFGVMVTPVYVAEISTSVARGSFTSFPEIFINIGILLGYISNYAFSGLSVHINWRVMLGVGILPSIFIGCALGAVGSRVSSSLIAMTFLSVSHAITVGGTFFVFSLISALSVAFVYKCVP
ncbi:hypothetical protein Patl1_10803 [Pistacia atlantica]|uniref:Uncharacterized protein n=1 Tax=Pistacia atlantica TaxID=434234 RepID=A0ACC1A8H8_9ROSI|nr:hypothetical protein Patl1_10803 [Pistacia atlantica]